MIHIAESSPANTYYRVNPFGLTDYNRLTTQTTAVDIVIVVTASSYSACTLCYDPEEPMGKPPKTDREDGITAQDNMTRKGSMGSCNIDKKKRAEGAWRL